MSSRNKDKSQVGRKRAAPKERVAQMRAEQEKRDRRRGVLLFGAAGLVAAVIIGFAVVAAINERAAEDQPIEGLQEFEGVSPTHVDGIVDYEQTPPAGGDHNPVWLNCGIYSEPVPNENAVHSLEHGVVWITYRPDLDEGQVEQLRDFVTGQRSTVRDKLLLSPYEGLPAPVVASAWGRQVQLNGADDPRLERFTDRFINGSQSPEPGQTCAQGVGTPNE